METILFPCAVIFLTADFSAPFFGELIGDQLDQFPGNSGPWGRRKHYFGVQNRAR